MNREEARVILQACRPNGSDAGDPAFAEALALARQDPVLAAWFAGQQALDAGLTRQLGQVPAPPRLKAEILAQIIARDPAPADPVAPVASSWFLNFTRLAWAAAVALVFAGFLAMAWLRHPPAPPLAFSQFARQMVYTATLDQPHVDREVSNLPAALASLALPADARGLALPPAWDADTGLRGCRALLWHGQKVAMLCFNTRDTGHVDLFVTAAAAFPDAPPADQVCFAVLNGSPTASWTRDDQACLAVGHDGEDLLKSLWSPQRATRLPVVALRSAPAGRTPRD